MTTPGTADGGHSFNDSISRDLFGDNYPRLQRLKAEYDAKNDFFQWFLIMPDPNARL